MVLMSTPKPDTPTQAYKQTIRLGPAQLFVRTIVETVGTDEEERQLEKDLEADAFRFASA
jgi:hypothetical protein